MVLEWSRYSGKGCQKGVSIVGTLSQESGYNGKGYQKGVGIVGKGGVR